MFGSKSASPAEITVIGRGAVIEGTIRASGRVQVDGRVEGTLEVDGHVCVGPSGSISGEVIADELAIGGRVQGKANARAHLHVISGGAVEGEVRYGTLQVDRGGVLHGNTAHGESAVQATSAGAEALRAAPPPPPLPAGAARASIAAV